MHQKEVPRYLLVKTNKVFLAAIMGDEGMDPCECIWNHELAMRRLISLVSLVKLLSYLTVALYIAVYHPQCVMITANYE